MEDEIEDGRDTDLDEVLAVLLDPVGHGQLAEALLALVELPLFHELVDGAELDKVPARGVPDVLDLLVDEVERGASAAVGPAPAVVAVAVRQRDHILFENLLKAVLFAVNYALFFRQPSIWRKLFQAKIFFAGFIS